MAQGRRALDSDESDSDFEVRHSDHQASDYGDNSPTSTSKPLRNLRSSSERASASMDNDQSNNEQHDEEEEADNNDAPSPVLTFPVSLRLRKRPNVEEVDEEYKSPATESSEDVQSDEDLEIYSEDEDSDVFGARNTRGRAAKRSKRQKPPSAKRARRSRRSLSSSSEAESSEIALDEQDEEWQESEPPTPPPPERHLRARQPVNYEIIPPPTLDEIERAQASGSLRSQAVKNAPPRSLFPVHGPFGGKDVRHLYKIKEHELREYILKLKNNDNSGSTNQQSQQGGANGGLNIIGGSTVADTDPLAIATDIDFDAVGGLDDYIDKLKEMVSLPLLYPEVYQKFNVTPPRGVLFHGPPGTGKTLMARALAASCTHEGKKITFFMRKGSDCLSKWMGEAERQLRALFEEAKTKQPSIIFFDEIDGLAPVRSSKQEQTHASIVSTMLALMDGMDNRGQVVVIGATNRPDSVDPALRRPGRFDREFYFPLPDLKAREKIIQIHTKKWIPPLRQEFIEQVAEKTKGYGGADLRALCTESALNAIQRTYPQIYNSKEKLEIDVNTIQVKPRDFAKSMEKIVPSSQRSVSAAVMPLPERIAPLLNPLFKSVLSTIHTMLPSSKVLTSLEEAVYEFGDSDYEIQEELRKFQNARVHRPRLLLHGPAGRGQEYLGPALSSALEGVYCQSLDLSTLYGDAGTTPESGLIRILAEARKRTPSMLLIPNLDTWFEVASDQMRALFFSLFGSLLPTDKILIIGISSSTSQALDEDLVSFFGKNSYEVTVDSSRAPLEQFYSEVLKYISMSPGQTRPLEDRPRKRLEVLKPAPISEPSKLAKDSVEVNSESAAALAQKDLKTRNMLKVKLGGIMDMFKKRYKMFRKPAVADEHLIFLFQEMAPSYTPLYELTETNMIRELETGKHYHNMDLDIMEDRLWNGYYIEPIQFLQDVELIHADAVTQNNRDRLHKSSEMLANAQVAIDEINDPIFLRDCADLRRREIERELAQLENGGDGQPDAEAGDTALDGDNLPLKTDPPDEMMEIDNASGSEITKAEPGQTTDDTPVDITGIDSKAGFAAVEDSVRDDVSMSLEFNHSSSSGAVQSESRPLITHHVVSEIAPTPTPDCESDPQANPESVSASMPEPEALPPRVPDPEFTVDVARAQAIVDKLVSDSIGLDVDHLERRLAAVTDVICHHQSEWNRDSMLTELENLLRQF